jgi:hypothetical protein
MDVIMGRWRVKAVDHGPGLSNVPVQSTKDGLQVTEFGCHVNSPVNLHGFTGREIETGCDWQLCQSQLCDLPNMH